MDLVSRRYLIHGSLGLEPLSPITSPESSISHPHLYPPSTSFPIIAIAVIGILATAILLVGYYIFVIKCCLNWHRIDLLRRFSPSGRHVGPLATYSLGTEPRGLDEAVIRLIPVIQYKSEESRDTCECAVCLNEFQENEKLRIVPNCRHFFHIDCIDVWLQNNPNCPLCRTSISLTSRSQIDQILNPRPSTQNLSPYSEHLVSGNEDFVVIELGGNHNRDQNLNEALERGNALELPISPLPRKLEQRTVQKKARKRQKVTSMGDECIDIRAKDDQFSVQPIRRSFSMDSSGDRQLYLAVQEALQQKSRQVNEIGPNIEGSSGNGRVKRSFFSFGHGSRSRSAVLPVYLDPENLFSSFSLCV